MVQYAQVFCLKKDLDKMVIYSPVMLMCFPFQGNMKWTDFEVSQEQYNQGVGLNRKPFPCGFMAWLYGGFNIKWK